MKQSKSYSSHQNQQNLKNNIYIENMTEDQEYISSNNTKRENEIEGGREEEIQYYIGDNPEENALEYKMNNSNKNNLYTNSYPNFNIEQNQLNYVTYQGNNKNRIIANNLNQNDDRKSNINTYTNKNEIFKDYNGYDNLGEVYQKNIIQRVNNENKNDFKIQGMNMKIENNYLKKSIKEDSKNDIIKEKRKANLFNEKEESKNFVDIIKNKINNKAFYKSKINENLGKENEKEKEFEINENENFLKDSLNESNNKPQNKYMENEKLVQRGKINSHTNSAKIYLNNNINNDYKTVSSEKISIENYNDSNLHYFNPNNNNLDNDSNINDTIIDNVGKKEITKLKYKFYKSMNNLSEYNMNEIINNYESNNNDLDKDIDNDDNNVYSKRINHQSDLVQDIINRYKYPVTYNFNIFPERKISENSNKRNIPVNKISAVYQKYNKQKNKKYINMSNSNNLIARSLKNKNSKYGVNTYVSSKSVNCIKQTNSNDLSDININNKINNSYNYSNNKNLVGNSSIKKTNIYHNNLSSKSKKDSYPQSDNINMDIINNPEFSSTFQYNSNFNTLISFDNRNKYCMNRNE